MSAARRPSLHAVMRMLAIAVIVTFSLSAVSIAYAAGRHTDHHRDTGSRPPADRAAASEAWG